MSASFATGALAHAHAVRGRDCYETPEEATRALLRVETIPPVVWEPACGPGAIVRVLRDSGRDVYASDIDKYGLEKSEFGVDFLLEQHAPDAVECIVTNPPYRLGDAFVRHALHLVPVVIMLLRLAYLEGDGRSDLIDGHLRRVWLGRERLPMMHRRGYDGPKTASGAMPFAWFVFTRESTGGLIETRRMSWRQS